MFRSMRVSSTRAVGVWSAVKRGSVTVFDDTDTGAGRARLLPSPLMRGRIARWVLIATVVAVVVTIIVQIPLTATNEEHEFSTVFWRVSNLFLYFTIVSNILVAVVAGLLLKDPDRRSTWFSALSLAALVNITITGIIYWAVLAAEAENTGLDVLTNTMFHTVIPILGVLGWLLAVPRGLIGVRAVLLSTTIPLAWLAMALIRGAVIEWYPYPFLDVTEVGYASAFISVAGVSVFFLVLASIAGWIDRRLAGDASAA
jgi:hypothetical protein